MALPMYSQALHLVLGMGALVHKDVEADPAKDGDMATLCVCAPG